MKQTYIITITLLLLLTGCSSPDILSEEEIKSQNAASEAVSGILFEHELDTLASYNVRKDGLVVIKFHDSVKEKTYTKVVNTLRKTESIKKVYAEQGGKEVCNLLQ